MFLITQDGTVYSTFYCVRQSERILKKNFDLISFSITYIFPKIFLFHFRVSCHTDYVTDIVFSPSIPVKKNIVTDHDEESGMEAELGGKEVDVILSVSSDKTLRRNCIDRKNLS